MRIAVCIVLAVLLGSCAITPEYASHQLVQSIEQVHTEITSAAEHRDVDRMFAHILEGDDVIIESGVVRHSRQEALEATRAGFQRVQAVTYTYARHHVTPLSKEAALWVGHGTSNTVLNDGRQVSTPFAESILFVRRDGRWMIQQAHLSRPVAG